MAQNTEQKTTYYLEMAGRDDLRLPERTGTAFEIRRVEIACLKGANERPAMRQSIFDSPIYVGAGCIATFHQTESFMQKCYLHAVDDETINFLTHVNRHMPGALHNVASLIHRRPIGPGRRAKLDSRH